MITGFLIGYGVVAVGYGSFVCASTWESWGGGSTPIWNGIISGAIWPLMIGWALLS